VSLTYLSLTHVLISQMLSISTPLPGIQEGLTTTPAIWAEDHVCYGGQCKIPSPQYKSRQYLVVVTATDEAGNSGNGSCSTKVGQDTRRLPKSSKSRKETPVENNPLFLIGEIEFVGGVEEEEDFETGDVNVDVDEGEKEVELTPEDESEEGGIFE